MVDYNIAIPQQQLFQAPDVMQNAMRMQQMQAQNMQMQQAERAQQQQNAMAAHLGSGGDMSSPEFRQKLLAVGGASAAPLLASIATMEREKTQQLAEQARARRYQSQSQVSDFDLQVNKRKDFLNRAPAAMVSDEAWAKYYEDSVKEFGPNIALSPTRPSEKDLIGFLSSASDKIRQAEAEAKAAQEAGQFTVQMTPAGPIKVNKLGQFGMATELPRDGAPVGGGAGAPAMPGAAAPTGRAGAAAAPAGFDMDRAKQAIAGIESGGRYGALGPVTDRGDRAFGKYQVMGANIPSWTKEALGRSMTPAEFLASPEAQERVFETQFGKSVAKYGNPADAASVWFSGRPLAKAGNASDVLGTTVPQYAQKFMAAYEGGANTPAMMRAPGFASSSGIPANVGLPVAPVLNALAGPQPAQQGNALAMQAAPMTQLQAAPIAAPQPAPALSAFQQAQQDAAQRKLQQRGAEKRQDLEIAQQEKIQAALPQIEDAASLTLKNIEGLIGGAQVDAKGRVVYPEGAKRAHPGFESSVGTTFSKMLTSQPIAGTSRSDFVTRFEQVKGGTFLDAYNSLRGGGAIDQKEGEKATAALNRMNLAQSEAEFIRAARDFEDVVKKGVARARTMAQGGAGSNMTSAATAAATAPQAKPAERQVKRSGMYNGRRVVEYSDGATEYAD